MHRINLLDTPREKVFDNITALASEICGTSISLITLVDEDRQWFKSRKGLNVAETAREVSYCAHALTSPDSLLEVEDALLDERFVDNPLTVGKPNVRFYAGVPLVYEDDVVLGTLCVMDKHPKRLSEAQKRALRILSEQVVELVKLHEATSNTAKLVPANDDYSNRIDTIVNSVADLIYEIDDTGRFKFVNDTAVKLLGYSRQELYSMTCWDIIPRKDQKMLWEYYSKIIKKKKVNADAPFEYRARTKSGKKIRLRQKVKLQYEGDRVVRTYAVATDVTSLHKAEKNERKNLEKYKLLANNITDLVGLNSKDGTYRFVSPSVKEKFGYSTEEMLGKKAFHFFHPEDVEAVQRIVGAPLKTGQDVRELKFRFRHKDGHYKWLDTYVRPILSNNVLTGFQTSSRDITDQVEDEARLKEYYQNLAFINKITASADLGLKDQLTTILKLGCKYLNLSIGIISEIVGKDYTVMYKSLEDPEIPISEGDQYDLGQTYCELVYTQGESINIHNVERSEYNNHPCHSAFGLKAYVGAIYSVDGQKRGTINFSSPDPRTSKFESSQLEFVEIIAKQIGFLISIDEKENKLRNERNLLNAFVKESPAAIAMFDTGMNYIAVSDSWERTNNPEGQVLIGKNHYQLFPNVTNEWRKIHQECLNGNHLRQMEELIKKETTEQWLRWEISPWYVDKKTIGGIIIYTEDISILKNQHQILQQAREEAEEASEIKQNFLSTMSHEIRTPLNSIIGFSNLLLRDEPRADQTESLRLLKFSSENLLSLVDNVLDLSKIQVGKIELEEVEFDLYNLVSSIGHAFSLKADEKQIDLILDYDNTLPKFFKGDKARLAQVLNNLISNAVKFTHNGKVEIHVHSEEKLANAHSVKFEIHDTGIGIPANKLNTIFQAFSQASKSNTRLYGGTGLGLTISKNLVEIMGGTLEVHSEESKGSSFYFSLYLEHGETKTLAHEEKVKNPFRDKIDYEGKILLVEDNEMNQLIATNFLEGWGLELEVAQNGLEAVEMTKSNQYGLILMDLQMPVMDGYDACKSIRAMSGQYYQQLPIMALTASAMVEIKDEVIAAGMNDYISKPYDPKELKAKLIKYLKVTD